MTQEMLSLTDEPELAACGRCHQTRELVATVHAVVRHPQTGEELGRSEALDLCGACVPPAMAEVVPVVVPERAPLRAGLERHLRDEAREVGERLAATGDDERYDRAEMRRAIDGLAKRVRDRK